MMMTYEYRTEAVAIDVHTDEALNALAQEGWRVVGSHVLMMARKGTLLATGGPQAEANLLVVLERIRTA